MTGPSVAAAPRSKACQGVLDITPLTKHRRREQCAEKRSSGAEEPSRRPVPLWKARDILLEAAQGGEMLKHIQQEQCWSSSPRGRSGESGGKSGAERGAGLGSVLRSGGDGGDAVRIFSLRLEVMVDGEELGDGQGPPLAWFGAQPPARPPPFQDPTLPRMFLRTPGTSSTRKRRVPAPSRGNEDTEEANADDEAGVAAAGIGAAHVLTGPGKLDDGAWDEASSVCSRMRYYGGARFESLSKTPLAPDSRDDGGVLGTSASSSGEPSPPWRAYGGHWLVLPQVELSSGGSSARAAPSTDEGCPTLSLNLRWTVEEPAQPASTASTNRLSAEKDDEDAAGWTEEGESSRLGWGRATVTDAAFRDSLASARARAAKTLSRMACRYARPGTGAELPLPLAPEEDGDPVMNTSGAEYRRWEKGINRAVDDMDKGRYLKVVLARTARLRFSSVLSPVDLLARFRAHYGFLFCLQPDASTAFVGCTPERLFLSKGSTVITEALAGTRGRGENPVEDTRLGEELMSSSKDMSENIITADYVSAALRKAGAVGLQCSEASLKRLTHVQHICRRITATLARDAGTPAAVDHDDGGCRPSPESRPVFGRGMLQGPEYASRQTLLKELHPTPAVCGKPLDVTYAVIGEVEGFDRGFYAGPVGYVSASACEFGVAIRSALVATSFDTPAGSAAGVAGSGGGVSEMTLFAGAGIVPGSTALSEWAETGIKMKNFLSLFPVRPVASLRDLPNVNSLWGTLVVEELVRLGVRHFCVCPGSRSAPLVVAIARHPSVVSISHHDERGAGFYAVGFARARRGGIDGANRDGIGKGAASDTSGSEEGLRLCAVVTSSGTAVANLLPAAAEADAAGLPILLLTADRPPELRGCGSNQTIDQVQLLGSRSRLSVDVQCPTDSVNASSLLSDIDHAVSQAMGWGGTGGGSIPGPVHLNFMFRENLAPVDGKIRDSSVPGLSSGWSDRCLDSPKILRWEAGIKPFTTDIGRVPSPGAAGAEGLQEVAAELLSSSRGLLVLGSLNGPEERASARHLAHLLEWPVYADITSGLRCWCATAGLGAGRLDQLLTDEALQGSLAPDAILQVGSPLISKRVQTFISRPSTALTAKLSVICSPTGAWHDPGRAFGTRLTCSVHELAAAVDSASSDFSGSCLDASGSELLALVGVCDSIEEAQTAAINAKANAAASQSAEDTGNGSVGSAPLLHKRGRGNSGVENDSEGLVGSELAHTLTEPFVAWCVSRDASTRAGIFLSASMPCRDLEAFADSGFEGDSERDDRGGTNVINTAGDGSSGKSGHHHSEERLINVASNRGASGIDGVISSAMGYATGLAAPVTLLIGDMATLHDLSSLHALRGVNACRSPVTIVCVNNGGGGIFSFLPIGDKRHADAFSPFFDTPHDVNFEGVCLSMGLVYRRASTPLEFQEAYLESQGSGCRQHFFIDAVTAQQGNVPLHRSLGKIGIDAAMKHLRQTIGLGWEFTPAPTPVKTSPAREVGVGGREVDAAAAYTTKKPTLLLLHGFMGSKDDWNGEFTDLASADGHALLTVDLPGHGGSRDSSGFDRGRAHSDMIWGMAGVMLAAEAVADVCDAVGAGPYLVVGYSMGGRVALALAGRRPRLLEGGGGLLLVSSSPGLTRTSDRLSRWAADQTLAYRIASLRRPRSSHLPLLPDDACCEYNDARRADEPKSLLLQFLDRWYSAALWGAMERRRPEQYATMIDRRFKAFGLSRSLRPSNIAKEDYTSSQGQEGKSGGHRSSTSAESGDTGGPSRALDLARSCLGLSVARQPDMWPLLRDLSKKRKEGTALSAVPIAYVAGNLDCRYGSSFSLPGAITCPLRLSSEETAGDGDVRQARAKLPPNAIAEQIASTCPDVVVSILPECAHAVPTEDPAALFHEVTRVAARAAMAAATHPSPSSVTTVATPGGVQITKFSVEEFSIPLVSPLQLSLCRLTERRGLLVRLQATTGLPEGQSQRAKVVFGVGEVTPLPGFHQETYEDADAQLQAVMPLLLDQFIPTSLLALGEDSLDDWLSAALGNANLPAGRVEESQSTPEGTARGTRQGVAALLPSVRCGIEMALLHLLAGASGVPIAVAVSAALGLPCRGAIEINGLAARGELSSGKDDAPRVIKVKVGGAETGPAADVARTFDILRAAPRGSTVRLDANQAWTMDEALHFSKTISAIGRDSGDGSASSAEEKNACQASRASGPCEWDHDTAPRTVEAVDYIEEPIRDPRLLGEFWERSGGVLSYALDESLAMWRQVFTDDEILQLKGCAAFVIKLSVVGGLSRSAKLCRLARRLGAEVVLSSAFESGVGLAHAAIFASCFATEGVAHGLSTYSRLDGDVAMPGFSAAIMGGTADVTACQEFLDRVAVGNGQM